MWKEDDASQGLGMEIVDVKAGEATLAMTVMPHMVNGQRIAHGGLFFLVGGSGFAFAAKSHHVRAVAGPVGTALTPPAKPGPALGAAPPAISRRARPGRSRCR